MGQIYNRSVDKEKRKKLRHNMTKAEKILWINLRKRQLAKYKFRRQFSVLGYIIDFYCPALKLAIEVDGDYHLWEEVEAYDEKRQKNIEYFGIKFLRFSNDQVFSNIDKVVDNILSHLPPCGKGRQTKQTLSGKEKPNR